MRRIENGDWVKINGETYQCEDCFYNTRVRSNIEKHHLNYYHLTDGREEEWVYLCRGCHQARHDKYNFIYNIEGAYDEVYAAFVLERDENR